MPEIFKLVLYWKIFPNEIYKNITNSSLQMVKIDSYVPSEERTCLI